MTATKFAVSPTGISLKALAGLAAALMLASLTRLLAPSFPSLAVVLSWLWFALPGFFLSAFWRRRLSWLERIPVSFVLAIGLGTPSTLAAIFLRLKLDHFLALQIGTFILILVFYLVRAFRNLDAKVSRPSSEPGMAQERWNAGSVTLLTVVFLLAGLLAFISSSWPPTGDDIAGLPIFAEVLRLEQITGTEPFHGSGTPSTPRNEVIVWTYQSILTASISGSSPSAFFMNSRPLLIILAFLATYTLFHQFVKGRHQALFLLSLWSIYMLVTTKVDGMGSNLVTRIIQDKFLGWFIIVPILLVFIHWYLESREARHLVGFTIVALGATFVHPITMAQLLVLGGSFGFLSLLLAPSRNTLKSLGWVTVVLACCLTILFVQHLRYISYAPIEQAGLGDAVEYSRIRMAVGRYRLWLLEGGQYVLHPSILLRPTVLLGYLLLPLSIFGIRKNSADRLIVSALMMIPVLLYIPPVTQLVGRFVTPYLMWRLAWPLELFAVLNVGLVAWRIVEKIASLVGRLDQRAARPFRYAGSYALLFSTLIFTRPLIQSGLVNLDERLGAATYSTCVRAGKALSLLDELAREEAVNVLASQPLNFCIPGAAPLANVIEYRGYGTVNRLPVTELRSSLQRVEDAIYFTHATRIDDRFQAIISRYDIDYVLVEKARGDLELQLRYLPEGFARVYDEPDYALYAVTDPAYLDPIISANTALSLRQWERAEESFNQILLDDPTQLIAYVGLGEALAAQGEIERAQSAYLTALQYANDESELHARVAETYLLQKDISHAISAYERAAALATEKTALFPSLGRAYLLAGQKDLAKTYFQKSAAHRAPRGSAIYHTVLAKQLADLEWFSPAIESYRIALEMEPDPLRYVAFGQLLVQSGNFPEAIQSFEQAIDMDPWLSNAHLQLGGIYHLQGQLDTAIQEYEKAWRLNPAFNATYILLGQAIKEKSGTEEAVDRLNGLATLNDMLPGPHRGLAPIYITTDQREAALKELDLGSRFQPGDATIPAAKGFLLLADGQLEQAQQAYDKALFLNPDLITAQLGLGLLYAENAEHNHQIGQLIRIARLTPAAAWPHLALADIYLYQGRWQAAQREVEWALHLEPDNVAAYTALGEIFQSRTAWKSATEAYQRALEIDPERPDVLVRLGQVHQEAGDWETAISLYERASQADNQAVDAYTNLAKLYWQRGLADLSVSTQKAAVESVPDSAIASLSLANSLRLLGRAEEARSLYERVVRTDPAALSAYTAWAQLEMELDNDPETVLRLLKSAVQASPKSSTPYRATGQYFLAQGELEKAEAAFVYGVSLPLATPEDYLALCDLRRTQGDLETVFQTLQAALAVFPNAANIHEYLGSLYLDQGDTANAQRSYRRAIQIDPAYTPAYLGLSQLSLNQGDMQAAQWLLEQALTHNPTSGEAIAALALQKEAQGDISEAESDFRRAVAIAAGDPKNYQNLGDFYRRQGRYTEALEVYQQALDIPPLTPERYLDIGDVYLDLGKAEEALQWYETAILLDSSDPSPYLAIARLYESQDNWNLALNALQTAVSIQPNHVEAHMILGNLYQDLARFEEARDQFETACSLDRSQPACLIAHAKLNMRTGDWSGAAAYLEQAIRISPTELEAYITLGEAYQIQGESSLAEDAFARGIEKSFDRQAAYLSRAAFHEAEGRWDSAQADYVAAWQSYPDSELAGLQLARFYTRRDELERARTTLHKILELPDAGAPVYQQLGDVNVAMANWAAAEGAYKKAIQLDDTSATAHGGLARVLELQGRMDEALRQYQAATIAAPSDPQAWNQLGLAYQDRRDYPNAISAYKRALSLDAWNSTALISLDNLSRVNGSAGIDLSLVERYAEIAPTSELYLTIAILHQQSGSWSTAGRWYRQAISFDPYNSDNWLALASYHRFLEEWDLALVAITTAQRYDPSSSHVLLAMGDTLRELGLEEQAARSYQQAIDATPNRIDGYVALASLLMDQAETDLALEVLASGMARAPADARGYLALGALYGEMGDLEGAAEIYQVGLKVIPGAAPLYVSLGDISSGHVADVRTTLDIARASTLRAEFLLEQLRAMEWSTKKERRRIRVGIKRATETLNSAQSRLKAAESAFQKASVDLEAARTAYLTALELDPGNELALIGLGRLSALSDSMDEALQYYHEATVASPASIMALKILGNTYLELRRPEQALPVFQTALQYAPHDPEAQAGLSRSIRGLREIDMLQAADSTLYGQNAWDNLVDYLRWEYR